MNDRRAAERATCVASGVRAVRNASTSEGSREIAGDLAVGRGGRHAASARTIASQPLVKRRPEESCSASSWSNFYDARDLSPSRTRSRFEALRAARSAAPGIVVDLAKRWHRAAV